MSVTRRLIRSQIRPQWLLHTTGKLKVPNNTMVPPPAACPELNAGDPGMCSHGLQQPRDGLRDGPAVAAHMEPAQELQRVGNLDARQIKCGAIDAAHRVQVSDRERAVAIDLLPDRDQCLIAEREEGPA
jgi:hypothetical protein